MTQAGWIAGTQGLLQASGNWRQQMVAAQQAQMEREHRDAMLEADRKFQKDMMQEGFDRQDDLLDEQLGMDAATGRTLSALLEQSGVITRGQFEHYGGLPMEEQAGLYGALGEPLTGQMFASQEREREQQEEASIMAGIAPLLEPEFQNLTLDQITALYTMGIGPISPEVQSVLDLRVTQIAESQARTRQIETQTAGLGTPDLQPLAQAPTGYFNRETGAWTPIATRGGDPNSRCNRHNTPTAMITAVARDLGGVEGVDYTKGDPFTDEQGNVLYTARLLGDGMETTIKLLDSAASNPNKRAFYTQGGQSRWGYTAMSDEEWLAMSHAEKVGYIDNMYAHEDARPGATWGALPSDETTQDGIDLSGLDMMQMASFSQIVAGIEAAHEPGEISASQARAMAWPILVNEYPELGIAGGDGGGFDLEGYDLGATTEEAIQYREDMLPPLAEPASFDELVSLIVWPRQDEIVAAETLHDAYRVYKEGSNVIDALQDVSDDIKERLDKELFSAYQQRRGY